MGDLIKSVGGALGDEGKTKLQRYTLWPSIRGDIESQLKAARELRTTGKQTLADWVKEYLSPSAGARTREEISTTLDPIYSGDLGRQLAGLSRTQTAAERMMLDSGANRATREWKGSMAGGVGGPSSYDRRLLASTLAPYYAQFATTEAARNRGDFDYLNQLKLANLGRRTAMEDSVTDRPLRAMDLERALYSGDLSNLANLLNLYKANTPYGFKYEPSWSERSGDIVDGLISAAATVYGMGAGGAAMGAMGGAAGGAGGAGGLLGMFGGSGGGQTNTGTNLPTNFGALPMAYQTQYLGLDQRYNNPMSPYYVPPGYYE